MNHSKVVPVPSNEPIASENLPRDLDELLTAEDVAAILRVSTSWVYEHTRARGLPRSDRLPHIKLGKYVRFDAKAVREFLLARSKVA
jgi:predicted DNA-binding transcriptional regulator AlpA